ncbi:MAG TPA: hypothetical protein VNG69_08265 [Casimicrobiaceae bacterium]|nr:hypothetical protein [Casimicrobiaceae bacterium]
MNNRPLSLLAAAFAAFSLSAVSVAQEQTKQIPRELGFLVGTYTGAWTAYGVSNEGLAVKQASWTDTVRAEKPTVRNDKAFVTTTAEMVFDSGDVPPMKVLGTEGYLINADGTVGDYFIETFGQTYRMQKLAANTWVYVAPAHPRELASLGFVNALSGEHVLIKVRTTEQGAETHRISRVTTVNWKDADGRERWAQYTSLQGFHKRQAP